MRIPGKAASLREAHPPAPPPEEWLGMKVCAFTEVVPPAGERGFLRSG